MTSLQTKPYALHSEEGQRLYALGAWITVMATAEQTGGVFNLFDISCPPGFATELHIHYVEDVAVYVLEGALTFFWGSEKKEARAGSFFFQPRGTPHGFRVESSAPARIIYQTFPGGLDRLIVGPGLQGPCSEAVTSAARYKIEILGPLPE